MYAQYFGLSREPFSIAPDPRYLFMSERHREALAHLLYGMESGGGFVLLSGEIGTGKTTVCRYVLEQIPERCNLAYIFNPKLTVLELLQSVCDEFHVARRPTQDAPTIKDYVDPLNQFLLQAHASGRSNVLIIDEAQNLSADVLEQLRLLTNLETNERKLLQIILIGQPELRRILAQPQLEQLAQRVVARFHLAALSEAETAQYIAHRLTVAGLRGAIPFEQAAIRRIHRLAGGVPRRINLLCDRAMLGAFATGQQSISRAIVERAASEVMESTEFGGAQGRRPGLARAALLALGLALGAGVVAALSWQFGNGAAQPSTVARVGAAGSASVPSGAASSVAPSPVSAGASDVATDLPAASVPAAASAAADIAPAAPGLAPSPPVPQTAVLGTHEVAAWGELASLWGLQGTVGDPCQGAAPQIQCLRTVGSLALIRQLGRPVLLRLQGERANPSFVLLTALGPDSAILGVGSAARSVSLGALGAVWRGEFVTLWRAPDGYQRGIWDGQRGPAIDWLAQHLAQWAGQPQPGPNQALDAALKLRVQAFQLAQGLVPDGRPGPMTLMLLNRYSGVVEPKLQIKG